LLEVTLAVARRITPKSLKSKEIAMFETEYRSPEQISREAAERYTIMVAVAERKAETKRVREQRRRRVRAEPVEAS
jgi:hypothetical protein